MRLSLAAPGTTLLEQVVAVPGVSNTHVRVWVGIGDDGAVLVFIDTEFEPTPDTLRVNVNDGGVFGYPKEET